MFDGKRWHVGKRWGRKVSPADMAVIAAAIQKNDEGIAEFKRISIPLIRRIYPQLIANQIMPVQPLVAPAAQAYYRNFRYN